MGAEFFGEPVNTARVAKPLLAVSDDCYSQCDGIDTEFAYACRDAIAEPGNVYVVSCPNFIDGECTVSRDVVGHVDESENLRIAARFAIDKHIARKFSETEGIDPKIAENVIDGHSGTARLLYAISEYGFRVDY